MSLWSTMPDGSNPQAVFGNYTQNPHCIFEARNIPGSNKLIFTACGHHAMIGGSLVLLDTTKGTDGETPMTRLTPEVCFPEAEGWPHTYFANPWPLSEEHYLVSWSSSPLPPGVPRPQWGMPGPTNDLGIYLFDAFGNLNLLYRDPQISSMFPLPVRPRPRPPIASHRTFEPQADEGHVLVLNVYQGLAGIPAGSIRKLRIVGVPAKTHPTMNFPAMGITRDDPGKFVLGTVPVEADGSAFFAAPSGVAFFVQALDEQGMAVQTMRSATYVQPGQSFSCIGCHEQRSSSPPNAVAAAALPRPFAHYSGSGRLLAAGLHGPRAAGAGETLRALPPTGSGRREVRSDPRPLVHDAGRLRYAQPAQPRAGLLSERKVRGRSRRGPNQRALATAGRWATTRSN